jgi:hypothetical protein
VADMGGREAQPAFLDATNGPQAARWGRLSSRQRRAALAAVAPIIRARARAWGEDPARPAIARVAMDLALEFADRQWSVRTLFGDGFNAARK